MSPWLLLWACAGDPRPGMVRIEDPGPQGAGSFWIDRYEFPGVEGGKPLVYVDLATASDRCAQAGKRLCTAAEWRRACQGPQGLRFGYGPRFEAGRCHVEKALPSGHTSMMEPTALVAASGSHPDCATGEGVVDMIGNAEEWVLDDWHGLEGMLEGGAWYTWAGYASCTGTYSRQPDYRLDPARAVFSAGFRCCWSQEAPDAQALTAAAIQADARARLEAAAALSSTAPYDPDNEVTLAPGLFMDLFEYPNRQGEHPRTVVTWTQAQGLCEAAGKRLCSAAEWERACEGTAGLRYPYGDGYVEGACAVSQDAPPRSGQAYACVSPSGAQDLVGGVWEWTSSELRARALGTAQGETLRELRGGSWQVEQVKGVCAPDDGYPLASQDAAFPDVGFRCCRGQAPPPPPPSPTAALRCPAGMAAIHPAQGPAFCVDRYELPGEAGAMPLSNLSLPQARQACGERGKRLCTQSEWLAACAGSARRRWPYGGEFVADRCNDGAANAPGSGGRPTAGGARPDCVTPEGVFDLSGNLWEWTATGESSGVLHGGGWNISAGLNQCRAQAHAQADHRMPEFGARCCASPDDAARMDPP